MLMSGTQIQCSQAEGGGTAWPTSKISIIKDDCGKFKDFECGQR